jgi:hypothetical protein
LRNVLLAEHEAFPFVANASRTPHTGRAFQSAIGAAGHDQVVCPPRSAGKPLTTTALTAAVAADTGLDPGELASLDY